MKDGVRSEGIARNAALKTELLALAARPDGFSPAETKSSRHSHVAAEQLLAKGLLFKVKFSHRVVRYYASKRMADAVRPIPIAQQVMIRPRQSAGWAPNEPVSYATDYKHTICPSPSVGVVSRKQISNW